MPERRAAIHPRRRVFNAAPDLMARLGHELRTPLNAILGFSELTMRETVGPVGNPRYVEYARLIHEGARRQLATIDAVLRLAELERGEIRPRLRVLDPAALVARAVAARAPEARRRDVALEPPPVVSPAKIRGDETLLRELIDELLANALAFTPSGGRVAAVCEVAPRTWRLLIRDTGAGIPRHRRAAVFDAFVRLRQAGVAGGEGPGLGLTRARLLAELHGGALALRAARGGGTVAALELPLHPGLRTAR